jgi:predicted nuclease of predicted toxin-antitoxin system
MRLLADENIPLDTVRALRAAGHDVFSAAESASGAPDEELLLRANDEERLVITFDRDFGELAARHRKRAAGGILLIRFAPKDAAEVTTMLTSLLVQPELKWANRISVVDRLHLRQRRL